MITREQLIEKYIEFFKEKKHKHIPSSSLIPSNDPTVLFTTAGMHPLVPFLQGQKHPLGKRLVSCQKCIRTGDIDEVGDETHHTFFEMLGNWSLGDYWKKEAIEWSYEFLTKSLHLPSEKLAVSVYEGDKEVEKDEESAKIWLSLGIPKDKIVYLARHANWWGPAGKTGPCGPDTEMFFYIGKSKSGKPSKESNPETDPDEWVEIWNDVFMQYNKDEKGKYSPLSQRNVDTGMGVERTLAILNGYSDTYLNDSYKAAIKEIEKLSGKKYGSSEENTRAMRIIADHITASVFILAEQVVPGNTEQGYVLRRLIRRAVRYSRALGIKNNFTIHIAKTVVHSYTQYQELANNHKFIYEQLEQEENKFSSTIEKGLKEFEKLSKDSIISGKDAFLLYQSYGFPIEMTQELANEKGIKVDLEEYNDELKRHQDLSRTSSEGRFKSGLADSSENTRKLHTATHLLNEALRRVLGNTVKQRGSNITPERLRFDFSFDRKLTEDEKTKVENIINEKIKQNLKIEREEMFLGDAIKTEAQAEFGSKYPEMVSVYTITDPKDKQRGWFSKEICTGPHVSRTGELAEDNKQFKIVKEESSSSGIRRIKAVLE